jgi:Uma2 family endonuclease
VLDAALLLPERPRPLRRAEYERLVELGAFEDERVELLRGVLVDMSPNDPAHASSIDRLTMLLVPAMVGRAIVRVQLPLIACDESEPEPDLAIVPVADYRRRHPDSAHLVIEVAISSLNKDRSVKAPLYAASDFSEYWIVNVPERVVEVHRSPTPDGYAALLRHGVDASVSPLAFPDVVVPVARLFE